MYTYQCLKLRKTSLCYYYTLTCTSDFRSFYFGIFIRKIRIEIILHVLNLFNQL